MNGGGRGCLAAVAAAGPDDTVTAIGQVGFTRTSTWICRIDATSNDAATATLAARGGFRVSGEDADGRGPEDETRNPKPETRPPGAGE